MKYSTLLIFMLILVVSGINAEGQKSSEKASDLISKIIEQTGANKITGTVDVIKDGNPDTEITGIVTCMFATMEVLKKAVEIKSNLIIVHEPLYYNHRDETTLVQNDPVYLEKHKYINDNKLVIWRFHDYIHSINPDGIEAGMIEKLGWKSYQVNNLTDKFTIPEITLNDLLKKLKATFPGNSFNVVGNPEMTITGVRLSVGAPGSANHIRYLQDNFTDLLIAGESPQWETYEYARDAVSQGRKKAVIFLGHATSEEAGMEYSAKWLKGFIKGLPITFVESGPSYWTY